MSPKQTFLTATAMALLTLGGCATGPLLVSKGHFAIGQTRTNLSRDWSDISTTYRHHSKKVSILSIDGKALNLLFVSDGLSPEDPLIIPAAGDRKNAPAPRGKSGMSLSEQIEFVATSVTALDYQKVETSAPQPVAIGGIRGVRFALNAKTRSGLEIRGMAQAVSKNKKSYYVIYLAPSEHYYDALLKDAVAVMDALVLPE